MSNLSLLEPKNVFSYFESICAIPHGSGNMTAISDYCLSFAKKHGLKAIKDDAQNVIIYKNASVGYETAEPIILQGHLDMVCQKADGLSFDFEKDGIMPYIDGDFIKAKGTTLGADNGIAVAMILSILADDTLAHPPIEAVFTTDEEIGMIGADKLDMSLLKSKRMINLDAEEGEEITVCCAGGSDFTMQIPFKSIIANGVKLTISIDGLTGGHSGVEIDKGRINANILLGRILNYAKTQFDFNILSVGGGSKGNAIPRSAAAEIVVKENTDTYTLNEYIKTVKQEILSREGECDIKLSKSTFSSFNCLDNESTKKVVFALCLTPNGIIEMSKEVEGLVETSLNLGILATNQDSILMHYALRSNKSSALEYLEQKMTAFADYLSAKSRIGGRYLPWEYKPDSTLRDIYVNAYLKRLGKKPNVMAIHAGLECAVFASKIKDIDCIAIGPDMFGVHTTEEKLSIASVNKIFTLLCDTLAQLK